jgi:tetratricopeptide (TPR) repeat protein
VRAVERARWVVAALWLVACGGAAADHEALGDRAYGERHFADALAEYRLAIKLQPSATLRAKAGAAALHASDFVGAVEEYRALAKEGGSRRAGEAADGLERVARAAAEGDDPAGLAAAVGGLRAVAGGRALASFARQLAQSVGPDARSPDALSVLSYAAAGAPDARAEDSLMYAYATALARIGRCGDAIPVFEAVARRAREPALVHPAQQASGRCALALGRQAIDGGKADQAEQWFRRAASGGEERDPLVRAAYIGIGDVLFARGSFAEAAEAYQRALAGAAPGDSLAQIAAEKLNQLANGGTVIR